MEIELEEGLEGVEVALKVVPEPVGVEPAAPVAVLAAAVPLAVGAVVEGRADTSLHERSYRGVSLSLLPTIPKLGFGVTGAASWRVNQNMLIFPKLGHPTASQ